MRLDTVGNWKLILNRKEFKTILRFVVILLLILGFPLLTLNMGLFLYSSYWLMNLMAIFPALNFIDFLLLAVPFAACQQIGLVQKLCTLLTFRGKRNLLNALRRFGYNRN